jgi:very-short-patch-repair endonuclease
MSISEAHLWNGLRGGKAGARFRRQVPIGIWIADFATLQPRLVVEVDGPSHDWADESVRTAALEARGFTVIRFTNHEVASDMEGVVLAIRHVVGELRTLDATPAPPSPADAGTPPFGGRDDLDPHVSS